MAIVNAFKGLLSLTGHDALRIETRTPITTHKRIHYLEVIAKNPKNFASTAVNFKWKLNSHEALFTKINTVNTDKRL